MKPLPPAPMWWLIAAVVAGGLLRVALGTRLPIGDDEAYYWLWSRHLDWAYPDHPPMIAALIAVSTRLLGDGPFGIRALTILLATATPLIVYRVGRELFGRDAAVRSALLVAILPAFALGTVFAFPDVPLAFFWVLALWAGWRALQQGGWWWPVVGALAGLALLSKLTALGFIAGLGGAWLWGSWRRPLREPAFYLGALLAAALFAPVVLWNIRHDWFTLDVTFNRDRWVEAPSAVGSLLIFAGAQLVYYGAVVPVLVAAAIAAAGRFREAPWRYLAWMSLPMFAATLVGAPGGFARPHWPGPAYLAAALALGALWPQWQVKRPRLLRAALGATALATVVLLTAGLTPWGTVRIRDGIGHWERVAAAAGRQAMAGDPPALIVAEGYQTASHLAYHLRERVPVTAFQGAFLLWQRRDEWTGRRVVYVDEHPTRHRIDIQAICRNLRPLEDVTVAPRRRITLHGCEEARFP